MSADLDEFGAGFRVSGDIDDFRGLLAKVGNGVPLGIDEAERAFDIMTNGDATPAQMGAFLMGLKVRGETAEELAGGARALRAKVLRVKAPEGAIDIVGTGGDHQGDPARGFRRRGIRLGAFWVDGADHPSRDFRISRNFR